MKLNNLDEVLEYINQSNEECICKEHCKLQYNKDCVRVDYDNCGIYKMINKYGFDYLHLNVGSKL